MKTQTLSLVTENVLVKNIESGIRNQDNYYSFVNSDGTTVVIKLNFSCDLKNISLQRISNYYYFFHFCFREV